MNLNQKHPLQRNEVTP